MAAQLNRQHGQPVILNRLIDRWQMVRDVVDPTRRVDGQGGQDPSAGEQQQDRDDGELPRQRSPARGDRRLAIAAGHGSECEGRLKGAPREHQHEDGQRGVRDPDHGDRQHAGGAGERGGHDPLTGGAEPREDEASRRRCRRPRGRGDSVPGNEHDDRQADERQHSEDASGDGREARRAGALWRSGLRWRRPSPRQAIRREQAPPPVRAGRRVRDIAR